MPKHLFGTDGIRGVPGTPPMDDATLGFVGWALANSLHATRSRPRVLLGMDTRLSGDHIASVVAGGLLAAGAEAVCAGVITTPGVAWIVKNEGFDAGVIISASHNPYTDNGVKIVAATGMKFPDEFEADLERRMTAAQIQDRKCASLTSAAPGLRGDYLASLRAAVLPGAQLKAMKLVLDCANGAASLLAPELFESLGATVIAIHHQPDGRNINDGCGSLHPERMQALVQASGAALGVAFDGDADRAVFSSAAGRRVDGDGVLLAMGRYLKSTGKLRGPAIVGTTMANLGLEHALARDSLRLSRVHVGDRYVLEEMLRTGVNLGGEQSGHILFLDDATTGDGMLTAVKMASLVALRGPLDDLVADLRVFPQTIVNVRVHSKPPLESLPEVNELLAAAERALDGSGRIVLRYSGTEPLARVMVEAGHEADVRRWSESIASAIRAALG